MKLKPNEHHTSLGKDFMGL